jgi:hypothetical protein
VIKIISKSAIVCAAFAIGGAASAQSFNTGFSAGIYLPTNGTIRDAFGSQIMRFGFANVGSQRTGNFKIGTELDIISANRNGNRLFIVPFTLGAEQQLSGDQNATARSYIKPFAGLAYMDYGVTVGATRNESKVLRFTYGAEFGVVVSDHLRLAARYNVFPKTGGFDFSGLNLSATFSIR